MRTRIDRARRTTWRACLESVDDRIHRDAAQIGFVAMLSFVPLALLLFVYATAMILLFGAEFASEWTRVKAGVSPGAYSGGGASGRSRPGR